MPDERAKGNLLENDSFFHRCSLLFRAGESTVLLLFYRRLSIVQSNLYFLNGWEAANRSSIWSIHGARLRLSGRCVYIVAVAYHFLRVLQAQWDDIRKAAARRASRTAYTYAAIDSAISIMSVSTEWVSNGIHAFFLLLRLFNRAFTTRPVNYDTDRN